MNICMINYSDYDFDGRVRRYAEALARRGDIVDVFCIGIKEGDRQKVAGKVRVHRVQRRSIDERGPLSYLWKMLRFFAISSASVCIHGSSRAYDLVHVHSVPDFEVFASLGAKIRGAKVILDIHDLVPEFYSAKFAKNQNSLLVMILRIVEKLSIAFSNHVIISNDIWREKLINRCVRPDKITCILNYPDPMLFRRTNPRRKGEGIRFMYPGTLNWHQGLDIAVKAFGYVREEMPAAVLDIYGHGPSWGELKTLIEKLNLQDRVFLKGTVPIEQISGIMEQSDIGIIPKRNDSFGGEAFSTKILEFMSLGVPIIVSRTKIDKYYFNDSIVKFFEPENEKDLAQSMVLVAQDKELRQNLVSNATHFVQKNNWDIKKHLYLDLVDSLCGNNKKG